jgi:hypothetical protein
MPRSSDPCPDCGELGAPLIRYRPNEAHYFCEFCSRQFVEHEDAPTTVAAQPSPAGREATFEAGRSVQNDTGVSDVDLCWH